MSGFGKGTLHASEHSTSHDRVTGAVIHQLELVARLGGKRQRQLEIADPAIEQELLKKAPLRSDRPRFIGRALDKHQGRIGLAGIGIVRVVGASRQQAVANSGFQLLGQLRISHVGLQAAFGDDESKSASPAAMAASIPSKCIISKALRATRAKACGSRASRARTPAPPSVAS